MRTLENQEKGAGGEIQLTDAMARMIGQQPFHAVTFAGQRYDCGSKAGFIEATLALALEREDMGPEVRRIAERLLARSLDRQTRPRGDGGRAASRAAGRLAGRRDRTGLRTHKKKAPIARRLLAS